MVQRMSWLKKHALVLGLASMSVMGAEETTTSQIKAIGTLDMRPSYESKVGNFTTENSIELGAQLTKDVSVSYLQAINSNLFNREDSADTNGLGAYLHQGFLRTRVNNLLEVGDGITLSYQNRIYTPTYSGDRDANRITAIRNYLTLSKKISDTVKLSFSEIPILHINSQAGANDKANTAFQNRVYLVADFQFTDKLSLNFPLMFHQTRYTAFSDLDKRNNGWDFFVWINPELDYAITENYTVGLSYYNNESFFASDLSGTQFGDALESGIYQLVFTASL